MDDVRKTVTVLFCDMTESTALSERVDVETLRGIMMRYFELMRGCIVRYGGTVEKYIGDAVMAIFGVPAAREDDALRAVRAAVDMRHAITGFNDELARRYDTTIAIRIGVNTGEVVAATGDSAGNQALVSGEPVNLAARLEQNASPGEVLIGAQTYALVSGAVQAERVPAFQVKGKSGPVVAWRLHAVSTDAAGVTRHLDAPLLAREHEMSRLRLVAESAVRDRNCQLCTVFGDPGIGKTRLAAEFIAEAQGIGYRVGIGCCPPYGEGSTLGPVVDALEQLAGADGRQQIDPAVRDRSPGPVPEETFWMIRRTVEALAAQAPVLIVLDDLHWAAPALLDLVEHLVTRVHSGPVLLVCLARHDLLDRRDMWGGGSTAVTSFALRPLPADECLRLAQHLVEVSAHDVSSDALSALTAAAEGNPFFIEQMVALQREGDKVLALPASIHALIAYRLDRLGRPERTLLELAAVAGRSFDVPGLAGVTGLDHGTLCRHLELLTRRRLVEPGAEGQYQFTNIQIREVTYGAISKRVRADLHAQIARWLAQTPAPAPDQIGGHLAQSYALLCELGPADEPARAIGRQAASHLCLAGRDALRQGDLPRARSLLERGLALPHEPGRPPLAALADLADVLVATGELTPAARLFRDLVDRATAAGDLDLAQYGRLELASLQQARDGFEALSRAAEDAVARFESSRDLARLARSWLRLAQASQNHNNYGVAAESFERALAAADRAGATLDRATALGGLALSLWLGPAAAPAAIERCRTMIDTYGPGHPAAEAAVGCPLAALLAMRRRFAEARAALAAADRVLTDLGLGPALATVRLVAGVVEVMAGRDAVAVSLFDRSRREFAEMGDRLMHDVVTVHLARARYAGGAAGAALDLIQSCDALDDASPLQAERALARSLRARALADLGDKAAATPIALAAAEAVDTDSPDCRATVLLDLAYVLAAAGRLAQARDSADEAYRYFDQKGNLVGQGWAGTLLARLEPR